MMSRASTFIAAVWPLVRPSKPSGLWPIRRDRDLVRLGAAFTDLDARLLTGQARPGLSEARDVLLDLWRRTIEDATSISTRTIRGRRIRTTRSLVVMRETCLDGPPPDLAQPPSTPPPEQTGAPTPAPDPTGLPPGVLTGTPIYTREGPTFPSQPVMPVTML
jgi:hypothetical protein